MGAVLSVYGWLLLGRESCDAGDGNFNIGLMSG